MKNIELTEDHKSKLLEMCKLLFPEYNDFEITSSFPYYNSNKLEGVQWIKNPIEDAICLIKDDKDDYRSKTIHWFEFCMIHLSKKIFDEINKLKGEGNINSKKYIGTMYCPKGAYLGLLYSKNHPVDYLYEQFEKLKL